MRTIFKSDCAALLNASERFMTAYNAKHPNNPAVRYFSWAGLTKLPTAIFA